MPQTTGIRCPAILKFEKTPCDPKDLPLLASVGAWERLEMVRGCLPVHRVCTDSCGCGQGTTNDSYSTILGWLSAGHRTTADMQVSSICPATEKVSRASPVRAHCLMRWSSSISKSTVVKLLVSFERLQSCTVPSWNPTSLVYLRIRSPGMYEVCTVEPSTDSSVEQGLQHP